MVPVVVLVATTDAQRLVAEAALAFLRSGDDDRGFIVDECTESAPGEITVGFEADAGARLTLVDDRGWDWESGDGVCRCLLSGDDAVTVRLVAADGAGSAGGSGFFAP